MRTQLSAAMALVVAMTTFAAAFERTETREDCAHATPLRQPFFGDLHVHTRLSFDAFTNDPPAGPREAYAFAKGDEIDVLPCNEDRTSCARATIRKPLDFAAVTDHAEGFGETSVCDDPSNPGYNSPECILYRGDLGSQTGPLAYLFAGIWFYGDPLPVTRTTWPMCQRPDVDCEQGELGIWQTMRDAAEEHYDRTSACSFTTLVGYEWTGTPLGANLHRNVFFRNATVPERPISKVDTGPDPAELWRRLRSECLDAETGCDALAIPHNPNLSSGQQFLDPETAELATLQAGVEPLVEIFQEKGSSECRIGYGTNDELCGFELLPTGTFFPFPRPEPVFGDQFADRSFVRNVLKEGLRLGRNGDLGVNPWEMGFVGATDIHLGTPGAVDEEDPETSSGVGGLSNNPGGLTVVWAEENSRDSIFEALRRRETYATSGTRPIVRFFAGFDVPENLCDAPDLVAQGYGKGVPMGARLNDAPGAPGLPRFVVSALKDAESVDLERIQIVKGWVDADGTPREHVFDVAGNPQNGASVDPSTCAPTGAGASELCQVWTDPTFDASQPAFWYVRVLENPTCRWHVHECQRNGVNPLSPECPAQAEARGGSYADCCSEDVEKVIQERAWTSPIFWHAG